MILLSLTYLKSYSSSFSIYLSQVLFYVPYLCSFIILFIRFFNVHVSIGFMIFLFSLLFVVNW